MTRFVYIADTHLGADPMGYQQQPGFPERLPEIVRALSDWMAADGAVDFVLHGGDMVDETTDENLEAAARLFDLELPVYLCLGNHDLTQKDARERWLALAPGFFLHGSPEFTIDAADLSIHVVPNQWCEYPYYWQLRQTEYFGPHQRRWLTGGLRERAGLPHILSTHSPVFGLPTAQTGMNSRFHAPGERFTDEVKGLVNAFRQLRCVLSAHNHMTMREPCDGVEFVTVSSLVETPFEFKLFEVSARRMEMRTVSLASCLPFGGEYDSNKAYVQGRPVDRAFTWVW